MTEQTKTSIMAETTPLTLIQQLISQGTEPEKLGEFLTLQERWESNVAFKAYAVAMAECQNELPRVIKDRKNEHTDSMYGTLEAVNTTVNPIINKHGFSVSFDTEPSDIPMHIVIVGYLQHSGGYSKKFRLPLGLDNAGLGGKINKTPTQASGSTISYGRRYLKLMMFDITVANEDNDGNDRQTISEEQASWLESIVSQCEEAGNPLNIEMFNQIFHLPADATLRDIPIGKYEMAKQGLTDKLKNARKGNVAK